MMSPLIPPVRIPQLPNIDSDANEGIDNKNEDENEGGENNESWSVQEEND